jgi:hypothetical protein
VRPRWNLKAERACFYSPGAFKPTLTYEKEGTRSSPSIISEWRGTRMVPRLGKGVYYLAPLTFEPEGRAGWTPVYAYVNSQVPHQ